MSELSHILIVDDEPNVRLVFRTALESAGYRVSAVENGQAGLEELGRSEINLVLLDLQMPEMAGMETLRRLREGGNDVPVVIVTAHGSVPDAVEAMKLGAIDFLVKPQSPDLLRAVVAEVLRRHAEERSASAPHPQATPSMTTESQFVINLTQAKRSLNNRWFGEAEVLLKQAIGLDGKSAEAHNLLGVLHELRNEHDASYREYKAALRVDKNYEPAKHNMRRYYERFTFGSSTVPVNTGDA